MNDSEREQLERAYEDAHTLEDTSGRHWVLMSVLAQLGHPVNSRQEALRVAEELLYGLNFDDERYLDLADDEERMNGLGLQREKHPKAQPGTITIKRTWRNKWRRK